VTLSPACGQTPHWPQGRQRARVGTKWTCTRARTHARDQRARLAKPHAHRARWLGKGEGETRGPGQAPKGWKPLRDRREAAPPEPPKWHSSPGPCQPAHSRQPKYSLGPARHPHQRGGPTFTISRITCTCNRNSTWSAQGLPRKSDYGKQPHHGSHWATPQVPWKEPPTRCTGMPGEALVGARERFPSQ
jgi:hypothetical protein